MKIALIGSTRFIDKYNEWNQKLTKMGHVVYSVATISTGTDSSGLTDNEKETLDLVHLLKIQNSDIVCLITDASAYVGTSTKREIKWCLMLGKQIMLPEHFKGIDENLEMIEKALKEAISQVSPIDMKTKLNTSKIRI